MKNFLRFAFDRKISITIVWLFMAAHTQAQTVQIGNPLGNTTIYQLIQKLLDIVVSIGTPVAVFFIVYSGFLFVTAQGNPAKLENAKKALLWTLVGTAVLIGAWVFAGIIKGTIDSLK